VSGLRLLAEISAMTRPYGPRADAGWAQRTATDIATKLREKDRHRFITRLRRDLGIARHPALRELIARRIAELEGGP
jgi:hypothetical protein